ncbi:hypothetical protein BDV06DRAFT_214784 [Aspergillus oleicola]
MISAADINEIAIIDITALWNTDSKARLQLAAQVREACTKVVFFYIKNHRIPDSLIASLDAAAHSFFALPEEREADATSKYKKFRGFITLYAEKATGSDLSPSTGCFSEAFENGYQITGDPERSWPGVDLLGFREVYLKYFAEALSLSWRLMRVFCFGAGFGRELFDEKKVYPGATSRMLHFPPSLRLMAHVKDNDYFAILSQGHVPALQVRNVHEGRYSISFFFWTDYDTTVEALPSWVKDNRPACSASFKADDWTRAKFEKAYVAYNGEE